MKFHDRSTIDQLVIGEIGDKIRRFFLVNPDNLKELQRAADEQATKMRVTYHVRVTIRRGKSGNLDQLHLIKDPRRFQVSV